MDSKMLFFSNSISNPSIDYFQSFCCSLSSGQPRSVCIYKSMSIHGNEQVAHMEHR